MTQPVIEILPPEQEAAPAVGLVPAGDFGSLFTGAYANAHTADLVRVWYEMRDKWLRLKGKKSAHTRRAYESSFNEFFAFCEVYPWLVTADHVRAWQEHMEETGRAASSINQRLSAVSSFYSFVQREVLMVRGVEVNLFTDERGRARQNPFRVGNTERPSVKRYGKSRPLAGPAVQKLLNACNQECLEGARDYALLLTFLLTGWRSNEVLSMRWGDIEDNRDRPGEFVFAWSGKGGKSETNSLPAPAFHAIVAYLKKAGRYLPGHPDHIQPADYIWRPLSDGGLPNLRNAGAADPLRHISGTQANNVLRKLLRRSGVKDPETYHVHSLRHTFAHFYLKAKSGDILGLSKKMHHSSVAITQIYADSMQSPVDDYSQALQQAMGI